MVAPVLVAATSLHGALVAATLAVLQVVRAFQNLASASGTVIVTQNVHAFPKVHISCLLQPVESEERV